MTRMENYIKKIEITGLWGELSLAWNLNRDVNVLAGMNGTGKSTIIRSLVSLLRGEKQHESTSRLIEDVKVTFEDSESMSIMGGEKPPAGLKIDVITTFDNRLKEPQAAGALSEAAVKTELDQEICRIQKRYMSYQIEQGRRVISLLTKKADHSEIEAITSHKTMFFDIVDSLFASTGKKVNRESDELSFIYRDTAISPYVLSSGEKQALLILATVLTEDNAPAVLLMDEPEISLHFDWQSRLLEDIRMLNPHVQVIVSTHSPALIMNGWLGHVSEISDLVVIPRL